MNRPGLQHSIFISQDPYTGVRYREFPGHSEQDATRLLSVASAFYKGSWMLRTPEARADALRSVPAMLRQQVDRLAGLITREMGKPVQQSRAEILKCAALCDFYLENGAAMLERESHRFPGKHFELHFLPLGGILGVMPWNFPFWQVFRFAFPAMLAGNVVLLKPAPNVPACAGALEALLAEAVGEEGLFQVLWADIPLLEHVIRDPFIRGGALTGSERAGASFGARCAEALKPVVLELGGSDALIVCSDADLRAAAGAALESRLNNNGQTCLAAKRWIVLSDVLDDFIAALQEQASGKVIGDPAKEEVFLSCLSGRNIYDSLVAQAGRAEAVGSVQVLRDEFVREGALSELSFVPQVWMARELNQLFRGEEFFGPVAQLIPARDEEEALALANDSPFGLGASVWTADTDRAGYLSRRLECGFVAVNHMVSSDPRMPFGGIKRSGFGRELGREGIRTFVNVQTVQLSD